MPDAKQAIRAPQSRGQIPRVGPLSGGIMLGRALHTVETPCALLGLVRDRHATAPRGAPERGTGQHPGRRAPAPRGCTGAGVRGANPAGVPPAEGPSQEGLWAAHGDLRL